MALVKLKNSSIKSERLLDRFLRYVKVESTANEDSTMYPSTPGQLEVGKLLAEELQAMGIKDAEQDKFGVVMGTIPATITGSDAASIPVVAFNSHVDTSPETCGKDIKAQVIKDYAGGDIVLPGDKAKVITVADNLELNELHGCTIITTDGTTLLSSDDKSGVAVIMELANFLLENPEIKHGPIRVCFTPDEEIGHGVDHVDLKKLGADVCYTLDGRGHDEIDVETFSADMGIVTFKGINIHPSIGKGRMVNAIRGAGNFIDRLPRTKLSPETTEGREGFLHPYTMHGSVAEAQLKLILRDFDTAKLADWAAILRENAAATEKEFPGLKVDVKIVKQYRNMADGLLDEPRAVGLAQQAFKNLGRTARLGVVRGGTDGSRFTELGLPTPNLSTGEHNPHSPLEWSCLEEMAAALDMMIELVQLWGKEKRK